MHLLALPDELLIVCCEHVNASANRALRLTCKRMATIATERLFSHVHLLPTTDSANKARAILENSHFMPLVTIISIQASLERYEAPKWEVDPLRKIDSEYAPKYADETKYDLKTNGVISATFKAMLSDVSLFENLHRVELHFDWNVAGPTGDPSGTQMEQPEYREVFLQNVLLALNHPGHPASKVHSLSIRNLQDYTEDDILKSEDFKAVVSRLDSLELCVATEDNQGCPENNIHLEERHRFFGKDLVEFWLAPLQQNLVHLKIYSTCYWGYLPKCDLRPLHFPRLKSLALGNMTFTHEWQLDWIISHGDTLESLILDDCPIVHDAMLSQNLDPERYVVLTDDYNLPQPEENNDDIVWTYNSRWHDYFRKLTVGLPRLQHFGMGHGPWGGYIDPAAPAFEASASLQAQLDIARYAIFCDEWVEPDGQRFDHDDERTTKITDLENQYSCYWGEDGLPEPSYPDCWDQDQEALDVLMVAVEDRNARRQRV